MIDWASATWPEESLGEALCAIASATGYGARGATAPHVPEGAFLVDAHARDRWIEAAADAIGIEAEAVDCAYAEIARAIETLGPSVVAIPVCEETRYLALIATGPRAARVIVPGLRTTRVPNDAIAAQVATVDALSRERVDRFLAVAHVPRRKEARSRRQLLAMMLGTRRVGGMWILRPHAGEGVVAAIARKGGGRRAALFATATLAQVALGVLAWVLVGRGALDGVVEPGWLAAWALVSLTTIAAQLVASWSSGRLSIDTASELKARLLAGALRMEPNAIRARGSGQLLAMVSESEAIESAGLGGALAAIGAVVQLVSAAAVLAAGAGGLAHAALMVAFTALVGIAAIRFARRRARWTRERFGLAESFVENVLGNRTRVAQQPASDWHVLEDAHVDRYVTAANAMDRAYKWLAAAPSRGWLALGLLGLLPAMLASRPDPTAMAIALGGVVQAQGAFASLVASVPSLVAAAIAWRSVGELYRASKTREPAGLPEIAIELAAPHALATVLEARGLAFRYRDTGDLAVRACDLALADGDRVLLEGESGGGKSTLASLLAGLHAPTAGLVLLRGLDRSTVGAAAFRRRVANAPQFHENHILSGTLAFNLLMGRRWPASDDDRREAEAVCKKLGLGPLLARMPSGLDQVVGETGWQLSHGERSRVFLARALLQAADVVILDESFGALDPMTLRACMATALEHARTLVVIAHP